MTSAALQQSAPWFYRAKDFVAHHARYFIVLAIGIGFLAQLTFAAIAWRHLTRVEGQCISGNCENGSGHMQYREGVYSGQFRAGKPHGVGMYSSRKGDRYEGQWVAGLKHGRGVYTYPGGNSYAGEFVRNEKHGFGSYVWADGTTYTGAFASGQPEGRGSLVLPDGSILEGLYHRGVIFNGNGMYVYEDGSRYIGSWKDGKRSGPGVHLDATGRIAFAGQWLDDEPAGDKK